MKHLLYFSLGLLSGAGLAYYLTKRYYEGIIDEEIESVKEAYKHSDESDEDSEEDDILVHKQRLSKYKTRLKSLAYIEDDVNEDRPEVESEVDEETGDVVYPREGRRDDPYEISVEEFSEELCGVYDKETVVFWRGNAALVSEADEHMDVASTLGDGAEERLYDHSVDDVVYIRNERLGMDFEVCIVDGSYGEE